MTIFDDNTESFDCQSDGFESVLVDELGKVFDCLPENRLKAKLGLERWIGRSGYPITVMFRAYLASYLLNIGNTNSLIRRLQEDVALREICGFSNSKPLPNRRTFNRVMDRLRFHYDLIEWCMDQVLYKLREILPNFGTTIAIDGTDVHTHSDCDKKPVSDKEAGFVIKEGAVGHSKKWTWGYKLHLIADATYELPIAMSLTPGNMREMAEMMPLLRATKERISWFKPRYIIADRGYDDYKNFEGIVKEFNAEPIIKSRMEVPVFGTSAQPFCIGKLPLVYRSWDKDKGVQYQCPERAKKASCPLPEKCPIKMIWTRPVHDYRRFGHRIAKFTDEWNNLYSQRTAIERVNSRLKYHRRLDSHCFRGLEKLRLHCGLAILSLLGGALAQARRYGSDAVRVCVRALN